MGFLKKLLPIAANAVGTYFGGPAVGAAAGSATGALLGSGSKKSAETRNIADFTAAETGSVNAFTGARDASLGYLQPYREGGATGFNNALAMQTPGYQYSPSDPSYQWRLGQGVEAIDRSAAARGSLHSGGMLKDLTQYGQGLASTEFGADFARNNQLGQYGLQAANGSSLAQSSYANGVSNALFSGARGRDPARTARGEAISDQYGAASDLGRSVIGMFGKSGGSGTGGGSTNDWDFGFGGGF